jgi:PAB-dependent poly(A)-specific ribonuclease subunit 3
MNQAWSETGDRYILKLFRDFVFHSVGFDGEPIVDIAHIVQCLNKVKSKLNPNPNSRFFSISSMQVHMIRSV